MPPKRRVYSPSPSYGDKDELADSGLPKRARTEDDDIEGTNDPQVRRSSRNGKGVGGWMAQMQNIERIQVAGKAKLKCQADLDALTEDQEVNPMAPIRTTELQQTSKPRPQPRLKSRSHDTGMSVATHPPYESSLGQPSFALAEPGQQFGFKLLENIEGRFHSEEHCGQSLDPSPPPSSYASSIFSGGVSRSFTTSTSRAGSVCSSSQDDEGLRRRSSHLQMLAHASQAGVEAPSRVSRVSHEGGGPLAPKHPPPPRGVRSAAALFDVPIDEPDPEFQCLSSREDVASASCVSRENRRLVVPKSPPLPQEVRPAAGLFDESADKPDPVLQHPPSRKDVPSVFDHPMEEPEPGLRRTSSFRGLHRQDNHVDSTFASNHLDAEIDEISPSEDERAAESLICGENMVPPIRVVSQPPVTRAHTQIMAPAISRHSEVIPARTAPSGLSRYSGVVPAQTAAHGVSHHSEDNTDSSREVPVVQDVVAVHRRRNRAPRLPNNSQLATIRHQQRAMSISVPSAVSSHRDPTQPPETQTNQHTELPEVELARPRLQNASMTEGADPSQLQFYEPAFRDVIERAKQFSHCDAAAINSFPNRAEFNKRAVEYVEEAIEERHSRALIVPNGWWPQYSTNICKLLWEDLGNWRSSLRKKARVFVTQCYQWDPENRREVNKDIAKELLGENGLFLRDGMDEEGRTNNFAHPALSGLVVDFFYGGDKSVGKLFPEVFDKEVPRVAVAIAATALKVVLDEIASLQGEVNFRVATYMPVYLEMLGLMKKCDTSSVHAAKTKALRSKWAEIGSGGSSRITEASIVAGTSFDVVLD